MQRKHSSGYLATGGKKPLIGLQKRTTTHQQLVLLSPRQRQQQKQRAREQRSERCRARKMT